MTDSTASTQRHLHFDLSYLGPSHEASSYTLRAGSRAYPMARHTPETLQAMDFAGDEASAPTHFAAAVETHPKQVHLVKVFGPPAANGFPTLAGLAVSTAADSGNYALRDVAQAIVFLNPSVTTLTPDSADAVKAHIAGSDALPGLQLAIKTAGPAWNTPRPLVRMDGTPVLKSASLIIHEALHALGLGENPPSSRDITNRVNRRCW